MQRLTDVIDFGWVRAAQRVRGMMARFGDVLYLLGLIIAGSLTLLGVLVLVFGESEARTFFSLLFFLLAGLTYAVGRALLDILAGE